MKQWNVLDAREKERETKANKSNLIEWFVNRMKSHRLTSTNCGKLIKSELSWAHLIRWTLFGMRRVQFESQVDGKRVSIIL